MAPDDGRLGPLSHDLPCQWCGHTAHHYLPCGERCDCSHGEFVGIDTALGAT